MTISPDIARSEQELWLKTYYFTRAAVSATWVLAGFALGQNAPLAAILLIAYPAWDAAANYLDARRSGGLRRNLPQAVNVAVSSGVTIAVFVALRSGDNPVLGIFGLWALLAGILQLLAALRRWRISGAQWAMVLSGGQSALAGAFFIALAGSASAPAAIAIVPGYAALGALYFLISAIWLTVRTRQTARAERA